MNEKKTEFKEVAPTLIAGDDHSTTGQFGQAGTDKLLGTTLDGKIHIDSIIGQGGMSVVYKGTHLVLDRPVAIKVILPNLGFNDKSVMRLQQEAKAAFSLSHKNLASVHDVSITADGLPYLVMDFAEGETLADMLKRGPLPPAKAIDIFSQICEGLAAAHAQGVIHRDIKPGNIMIEHKADGSEAVRIVDFGIAKKVTENAEEIHKLTQTGEVFGTPLYMSPEQCRGDKLDKVSDVYSLGCVFYEALTGAPPYKGDSAIATIMAHLQKPIPQPPAGFNLPASLVSILHRCMEKESKDRYQSMDALAQDLRAAADGGKSTKKYVTRGARSQRRKIFVAVSLGAVALFGVICGPFLWEIFHGLDPQYDTIEKCNQKIAQSPDDEYGYLNRANLYIKEGYYKRALADHTACIKISKQPANIYAYRAGDYNYLGQRKEALADANKALELDPKNLYALGERVMAALELGDDKQALADAEKYIKLKPDDTRMRRAKTKILLGAGRFKEAIENSSTIIKMSPESWEDYYDRALAYCYMDDFPHTIEDTSKALTIHSGVSAYSLRGWAYFKVNRLKEAVHDLDTALHLDPRHKASYARKARILYSTGKTEEALQVANQLVTDFPDSRTGYRVRSDIYQGLGKTKLAEADKKKMESLPAIESEIIEDRLFD